MYYKFDRFYSQMSSDQRSSILKWTQPPVHDLRKIYEHFRISNVLDGETRIVTKAIDSFKVAELKYYCTKHGLAMSGKKVSCGVRGDTLDICVCISVS